MTERGMAVLRCMKGILSVLMAILAILCLCTGAAIVAYKSTGLRFCTVDGHSMDDTLFDGEQLVLNPSAEPGFGDIIVFEYGGSYLIKRVIGMPGDTVAVVKGILYVNNVRYDEGYLSPEHISKFKDNSFMVTVGEGEYFVMGDNRDDSRDGRSFGCIPQDSVIGVAIWHF